MLYVTESRICTADTPTRSAAASTSTRCSRTTRCARIVGRPSRRSPTAALAEVEMPAPAAIDYYAMIDAGGRVRPEPGDSVVFGFRAQAFVTRAYVAGVTGVRSGDPMVETLENRLRPSGNRADMSAGGPMGIPHARRRPPPRPRSSACGISARPSAAWWRWRTSRSTCMRAGSWRWWATTAPASRRWSRSSAAFMPPTPAPCCWTANRPPSGDARRPRARPGGRAPGPGPGQPPVGLHERVPGPRGDHGTGPAAAPGADDPRNAAAARRARRACAVGSGPRSACCPAASGRASPSPAPPTGRGRSSCSTSPPPRWAWRRRPRSSGRSTRCAPASWPS